jgi:mono/diheme cytochrome c family protein
MKSSFNLLILLLLPVFFITSCANENKDQLVPPGCKSDSTDYQVSYKTDIAPILENNCYGCHGNGNTGGSGGINLQDTTTLNKYINNGQLIANITHTSNNPMPPPPAQMLSDCEISLISLWIQQGAPKN